MSITIGKFCQLQSTFLQFTLATKNKYDAN
jgi:hypothetical protein